MDLHWAIGDEPEVLSDYYLCHIITIWNEARIGFLRNRGGR